MTCVESIKTSLEVSLRHQSDHFVLAVGFLLLSIVALGCDSNEKPPSGGDTGSSSSSSGSGGFSTTHDGVQATDFVSAGGKIKSEQYSMVFSFGQSTQNQQRSNSANHTLQGGVVGATQPLK